MQRERITITIEADLLPAVDNLIDGDQVRNRSHAIEMAIKRGLSINQITSVYFIYSNTSYSAEWQSDLISILKQFPLTEIGIIAKATDLIAAQEWQASLVSYLPKATTLVLPGDFGDASAILLNRDKLPETLLIVNLEEAQFSTTPSQLLAAHSFHKQQNAIATKVTRLDSTGYHPTGFTFLHPLVVDHIPTGMASLTESVFPVLAKLGKVSVYVCP